MVCFFYKTMVEFTFVTQVSVKRSLVAAQFNQDLLLKLKPPLLTMQLIRYDGQYRGDRLSFAVGIGQFTQTWEGEITNHRYTQKNWLFRDEGILLPHPLKTWKHTHALIEKNSGTLIVDRVRFCGKNHLFTAILIIPIAMMFWMRKPLYKRWLSEP
jgi:ligand-binding SRPBCC domain-containing protein